MKLKELGEFKLTKLISDIVNRSQNLQHRSWQQILVGIGDDAAAWQSDNCIQIATTDALVQDVHFNLDTITWEELGWKALAVNLSDIAAMGGIPQYALVSLSLPGELEVEAISTFIRSMTHLADKFETAIIGGNLTSALNTVITVTVIGYSKNTLLKRSTARPGEHVAVTGYLGTSAAGSKLLQERTKLDAETTRVVRGAHLQPVPRVKEGQILVQQGVRTAIDISDGLVADLAHICEASKLSARVELEQIPVLPPVKTNFPDYLELALYGGEDYELLFTAEKNTMDKIKQTMECPVTVIGEITEETSSNRVNLIDSKRNVIPHKREGWDHFRDENPEAKFACS